MIDWTCLRTTTDLEVFKAYLKTYLYEHFQSYRHAVDAYTAYALTQWLYIANFHLHSELFYVISKSAWAKYFHFNIVGIYFLSPSRALSIATFLKEWKLLGPYKFFSVVVVIVDGLQQKSKVTLP